MVPAHVADRIHGGDDPQPRGHEREQHPERLDLERHPQTGHHFHHIGLGAAPGLHLGQQCENHGEEGTGGAQAGRLAQIRPTLQRDDEHRAD